MLLYTSYRCPSLRRHLSWHRGIYGLTRERIRQIESKALKRLRHPRRLNYLYGFYELKENLQYSSETGEFSKLLTSKLMVDDIFIRIDLLKSSEKMTLEQNEFSEMPHNR